MNVQEIERILDELDRLEEMNEEQRAELVCDILLHYIYQMKPEHFKQFFKEFLLQNPEVMDAQLETLRRKWEKQLRLALKQRRREARIRRA